jgi:hypothetical protein
MRRNPMAKDIAFDTEFDNEPCSVNGASAVAVSDAGSRRGGIFQRFAAAVRASRQRAVEREVERFINQNGGRLTDELEREISRRFGGIVGS